jgi:PAS domain S-box-containing protein
MEERKNRNRPKSNSGAPQATGKAATRRPSRDPAGDKTVCRGSIFDIMNRKKAEGALPKSEDVLRAVVANAPVILWVLDREGVITLSEGRALEALGLSPGEVVGRSVFEVYRDAPKILEDNRRALAGESFTSTVEVAGRTYESLFSPIRDETGEIAGAIGVATETTERRRTEEALKEDHEVLEDRVRERTAGLHEEIEERKRAEAALKKSEERFRTSVETMLDAFAVLSAIRDEAGRIVDFQYEYVNASACRIIGMNREDLIGRTMLGLLPGHRESGLFGSYVRLVETGEPFRKETFLYEDTVDGKRRFRGAFDIRASRLGDGLALVWQDETEHVVAEHALKESEERFRTLVEHSLVGFFIVQKGQVVFQNPEQEKLFGGTPKSLMLADFTQVHPEDRERFLFLGKTADGTNARRGATDIRFLSPGSGGAGSRTRWTSSRMAPVSWHGRDAVLVNMVDLTQLKEMERIALIQEKMAALGHVAAGIAHEIRNPLSGLNIYLSALEKMLGESETLEPEIRETAGTVVDALRGASSRIEGVIRRVMDFANPAPPRMAPLCINHAVREAIHLASVILRKENIRLTEALQEDLPKVRGDMRLLEQVFLNLLTNALQAMEGQEGERRVEVASFQENGYVHISVADSGPGVPAEIRHRIFDPFFTTKKEGTGIGLSFSHRVVTDHGGFFTAGTSRFGGALFTIGLPVGDSGKTAGF